MELLRNLLQVIDVFLLGQGKLSMLALDKAHGTVSTDGSANLDLDFDTSVCNSLDNTDNLAIVKVDHIVVLKVAQDRLVIDSEVLHVTGLVELSAADKNAAARLASERAVGISHVRNANLSSAQLEHESASHLRTQTTSLSKLGQKTHVLFDVAVTQIESSARHATVEQLDHLLDLRASRTT